jgi:tetratricopeptide (TPR) repeat protein
MKKRIGPYQVEDLLGHGGSAAVYLGRHRETQEQVAIKLLHLFTPEKQAQATFRREVEVIRRLRHPGIIRILDMGIDEDNPYFTMPYASGGSLRVKHQQGEQLPLQIVQAYLQQLAAALQYAHENKVIHLDIKPENILVTPGDQLLLSDFGVARIIETTQPQTTQDPGGTLVYKAPEQFQDHPCAASDQYALAITIYEWLCGKPPFSGKTHERLLHQHLFDLPPSLRENNSNITEKLEHVVLQALAKKPSARFPDIQAFAVAFGEALEERPKMFHVSGNLTSRQPITASQVTKTLQQAQTYQTRGRLNDAIDLCQQILESGFDRPDARYFLGWLYQEQERWKEAMQQFEHLTGDDDYALSCYYGLGQCYRALGDLQAATTHFDEAIDRVNLDVLTEEDADTDGLIQLCQEAADTHRLFNQQEQALTIYNALLGFLRSRGWNNKISQVEVMLQKFRNTSPPVQPTAPVSENFESLVEQLRARGTTSEFSDASTIQFKTTNMDQDGQQATPANSVGELPDWLTGILKDDEKTSQPVILQPSLTASIMDEQSLPNRTSSESVQKKPLGFLKVEEGKGLSPGRIYEIHKESLSIGRSRESDIFLEDLAVSRLHASIVNMGNGSYALKEEGSANGTKVNGKWINKYQTYPLKEGDRIQLGQAVLVFLKK